MEELLPTFGDGKVKGMVNEYTGGCYIGTFSAKGTELILNLDLGIHSYDVIEICLFYNFKVIHGYLSVISGNVNFVSDFKDGPNKDKIIFQIYYSKGKGEEMIIYIKFPLGDTQLHQWNIRKLLSQNFIRKNGRIEVDNEVNLYGFSKIDI